MSSSELPKLIVVMGISGTGKSTLAKQVADKMNFVYLDADDYHSDEAKQLMAKGQGITTKMRQQWFEKLCTDIQHRRAKAKSIVLAFSGVKSVHRQQLAQLPYDVHQYLLSGDKSVIEQRLASRADHFAGANFLASQLKDFELLTADEKGVTVLPITLSVENSSNQIIKNIV